MEIYLFSIIRIAVEILFVRHEQKDWNKKPDPKGNAKNIIIPSKILPILLKYKFLNHI